MFDFYETLSPHISTVSHLFYAHPILSTIFLGILLLKLYLKWTTGRYKGKERLEGKTIIVTGANTGIGFEAAKEFARRGARVILACRSIDRGNMAKDNIIKQTKNHNVIVKLLNLSSFQSVREFASNILSSEERIDILVNNAAATGLGNVTSEDGIRLSLQINYFGPFLLTNLLLGKLKESSPSRIVNVSSLLHKLGNVDPSDLCMTKEPVDDSSVYNTTKLLNILMSNELARKLEGTGVTSNSLSPGIVVTRILRNSTKAFRVIWNRILGMFFKSPYEGAQTVVYTAVSPNLAEVSGEYFMDCKKTGMSDTALDAGLAKKIWMLTETVVKLRPSERHY